MRLFEIKNNIEWVRPISADLKSDFDEYKKKEDKKWKIRSKQMGFRFPIFTDFEQFESEVKLGKIFSLSKDDWQSIENLSQNTTIDDLKDLVSSYTRPRDVDRIVKGINEGVKMPLPIILKGSNGRWILAGNTRLNVARILDKEQRAIEIDVR